MLESKQSFSCAKHPFKLFSPIGTVRQLDGRVLKSSIAPRGNLPFEGNESSTEDASRRDVRIINFL
jgi:hypothetical protein